MKHVNGLLQRFAPRGMFSLAGALLFAAAGLIGCSGPPRTQSALVPMQSTLGSSQSTSVSARTLAQPLFLFVHPMHPTIKLNQHITIHADVRYCNSYNCFHEKVDASWTSSGGSLKIKGAGKRATFWASVPGLYTVSATYEGLEGQAIITVTAP